MENKGQMKEEKPKRSYSDWQVFKFAFLSVGPAIYKYLLAAFCFVTFSVISFLMMFETAKLLAKFNNRSDNPEYASGLFASAGLLIGGWILYYVFNNFGHYIIAKADFQAGRIFQERAIEKISKFDIGWFQKENSAKVITRINSCAASVIDSLNIFFNYSNIDDLIKIVGIGGFFAFLDIKYFAILAIYPLIVVPSNYLISPKVKKSYKEIEELREKNNSYLQEIGSNITLLKIYNRFAYFKNMLFGGYAVMQASQYKWYNIVMLRLVIRRCSMILVYAIVVLVMIVDYIKYQIDLVSLIFGVTEIVGFCLAVDSLTYSLTTITETNAKIERIMPMFEEVPADYFKGTANSASSKIDLSKWSSLKIKDLEFAYPSSETNSLHSISLGLKKGEKLGFVGTSGSGKSTLAKLLAGLFEVKQGSIDLVFTKGDENGDGDGKGLSFYDLSQSQASNLITLVPQDTEVFDLSVRDNLTLLKPCSEEEIKKAMDIAMLSEVVQGLPKGLDTALGEKGYKLSGGQKQRLGIARGILNNTGIIIFDEATSALDNITEKQIQANIEANLKDKTIIAIAHRLSTLNNFDKIMTFSEGRVIEEGTFASLVADESTQFSKLYKAQETNLEII